MKPEMSRVRALAIVAAMVLVLLVVLSPVARALGEAAYEDLSLMLAPSAERAYEYGNKYFDATHPADYDISRAERLFQKAFELDPGQPYVRHQLARIAFLKGDFNTALSRINAEIETNPNPSPSYYVRGLIKGYMDDFGGAAEDYETYLKTDPTNWAAINDYAWVLLKDDRPREALAALDGGLRYFPENPWLLNSKAVAHMELGELERAREAIVQAEKLVARVTEEEWLTAYPGNDPLIAAEGIEAFRGAVAANIHSISLALEERAENVR